MKYIFFEIQIYSPGIAGKVVGGMTGSGITTGTGLDDGRVIITGAGASGSESSGL